MPDPVAHGDEPGRVLLEVAVSDALSRHYERSLAACNLLGQTLVAKVVVDLDDNYKQDNKGPDHRSRFAEEERQRHERDGK